MLNHVKGCMMLYQSGDIARNEFCIRNFAAPCHVAEAKCKPPIRPRRLLSPTRACFAPIEDCFTCVCYILKHFFEHIVPKTTFSVSRPWRLEWRQIRRRPLQRSNPCWYLMLSPCLNLNCRGDLLRSVRFIRVWHFKFDFLQAWLPSTFD